MPEPVRIALRLLGLLILVVSAACLVLLFKPGPQQVAEAMGVTCRSGSTGPSQQCGWLDASTVLWTGFWVSLIAGTVLRICTRAKGTEVKTVDLRWLRSR